MAFDSQGFLFFSIGDRGVMQEAQNPASAQGAIHRIHDDGRIPEDNPFINVPGALPSLWTIGNRNPQGLAFQPETGLLWAVEHGPRGGGELNLIRRGANYGWPLVTHGVNYDGTIISPFTEKEGLESPVIHWTPSIAVGSLAFYRGDQFPNWQGDAFVTALAGQKLVRLVIRNQKVHQQEEFLQRSGRIRDLRIRQDGGFFVIYDEPGQIVRLVPRQN